MKSIGPYVVVREVTPGTANLNVASGQVARVSTFWATDRLTGMPALLHSLPYVVALPQIPADPALLPFHDLILQEGQAYLVTELPLQARPAKDAVLTAHGALSALKTLHAKGIVHGHIDLGQLWSVDGHVMLAGAGLHVLREHLTPADDLRDLAAALDQLGGLPPILSVLRNAPDMLSAGEALDLLNTGLTPVSRPGTSSPVGTTAPVVPQTEQVNASAWPAPAEPADSAPKTAPERPIPLFVTEAPPSTRMPDTRRPEAKPTAAPDVASKPHAGSQVQAQPRSTITGLQNLRSGDRDPLSWQGGQTLPQQSHFLWQASWSEDQEDAAAPQTQGNKAIPDAVVKQDVTRPEEHLPELKLTQFLDQFDQFVDPLPPIQPATPAEPELVPPELITSDSMSASAQPVAAPNGTAVSVATPRRSQKAAASRALERLRADNSRQAALTEVRRDQSRAELTPVKSRDDVVPGPSLNAEALHARAENIVQSGDHSETPQERRRRENEARREQAMLDAKAAATRKAERLREEAGQDQEKSKSAIQIGFAGDELPQWSPSETSEESGKTTQFQEVERLPASLRRPTIEEAPQVAAPKKTGRKVAEVSRSLRPIRIGWDEDHSWRVVREGETWGSGKPRSLLGYLASLPGWVLPVATLLLLALCILVYRVARTPSAVTPAAACCAVQFNLGTGATDKAVRLTLQQAPAEANLSVGQELGTAPGSITLPKPGTYQIGVSADGFRPASISVTAPASGPITINLGE